MHYWHPRHETVAVIHVATLSDVMSHTSQAEIATEKAMLEEGLEQYF